MSNDATIRAILRASNHFDALKLPRPHADLMDQPIWDVAETEINRAYRRLSLACHPDKSTHIDAPRAWETLKRAKACLLSPLDRDDYLLSFVKQQKVAWEGNWASTESAAEAKQRTASMRDAAKNEQGESVADAMRERREKALAAARKKERIQVARARVAARHADSAGEDDDDGDEETAGGQRLRDHDRPSGVASIGSKPGGAPRKRPRFL